MSKLPGIVLQLPSPASLSSNCVFATPEPLGSLELEESDTVPRIACAGLPALGSVIEAIGGIVSTIHV